MNNVKTIILDYKSFFPIAVFGTIFYFYAFITTINEEHHKVFMSLISILIIMMCVYVIIFSMEIVELNAKTITVYTFFKLGKTKKFNMKNVVKILQKTNPSTNNIRSVTLVFNNGKKLELNEFQRGFTEARIFLRECFSDDYFVVLSRWEF